MGVAAGRSAVRGGATGECRQLHGRVDCTDGVHARARARLVPLFAIEVLVYDQSHFEVLLPIDVLRPAALRQSPQGLSGGTVLIPGSPG